MLGTRYDLISGKWVPTRGCPSLSSQSVTICVSVRNPLPIDYVEIGKDPRKTLAIIIRKGAQQQYQIQGCENYLPWIQDEDFPKAEWERMARKFRMIAEVDFKRRIEFYEVFSRISSWSNSNLGFFYYYTAWFNNGMDRRPFIVFRFLFWVYLLLWSLLFLILETMIITPLTYCFGSNACLWSENKILRMLRVYPILDEKSFQNDLKVHLSEIIAEFNYNYPKLKFECKSVMSPSLLAYELIVYKRKGYVPASVAPRSIIVSSGEYYQSMRDISQSTVIDPAHVILQVSTIPQETVAVPPATIVQEV
jgi:hypothetical protein